MRKLMDYSSEQRTVNNEVNSWFFLMNKMKINKMKIISKMQNNNFLVILVRKYLVRISLIRKLKHTANKVSSTILGTATIHYSLFTIH
jgi:hypothetical protein